MNKTQRIVAYIWISTQEQADEGVSLAVQQARFEAYCVTHC